MILGIDEVGRGPWAGPLVIGAVVLPEGYELEGLTDSKKLSAKKRAALDIQLRQDALAYGLGWVHADELDQIGLSQALRLATIRAVDQIKTSYHEIIIDGTINFLSDTTKAAYVTTLPKADALIPAVSAASIIAKVARDTFMESQDEVYLGYSFASHVGYGTAAHRNAIERLGVTPLHRQSFAPIAAFLKQEAVKGATARKNNTTTKQVGDTAESRVAEWLDTRGMDIEARNWKTKWCEIDIVASNQQTRYFIEVKYRSSGVEQALESVTAKKQQQMAFAAELYNTQFPSDKQSRLAVVGLDRNASVELIEL